MKLPRHIQGLFIAFSLVSLAACGSSSDASVDAGARDASTLDARATDSGADAGADAASDAAVQDASADAGPTSRIEELLTYLASTSNASAVDARLHELALSDSWPLHEGARFLFVTRWDGAPGTVSFVSDVNAWSTTSHVAARALSAVHYFVVVNESEFAVPAAGAKYKWWGTPDLYRAPPEATAYGYDEFGEFGWVAPPSTQAYLERFPAMSSAHLGFARTLRARLPAGFVAGSAAASHLRTVLLNDGQNVFDPNAAYGGWHADAAIADGYSDVVAIAVDNAEDRFDAYTHVTDSVGGDTVGGHADDYLDALDTEFLPFVRARYGIVADGNSLMFVGSSLGGLVSLYGAMARPTMFGCVAGMSSTVGWGSISGDVSGRTVIEQWPSHLTASIYLDSGGGQGGGCTDSDGDGVNDDGEDSDNFCVNAQLHDRLQELGYVDGNDLFYSWDEGAGHNEAAWSFRFPAALAACTTGGWVAP